MKIELRERTAGHVRVYFEQTQDEQIERMLPRSVESLEQALANFEATLLPGAASFGRTIYADGRYVGDVWCYCIDCEQSPNAMLSYCIFDKALWGKGAATEAVFSVMAYQPNGSPYIECIRFALCCVAVLLRRFLCQRAGGCSAIWNGKGGSVPIPRCFIQP